MAELNSGQIIKTNYGTPLKVIKELGRGGQGIVYLIEFKGQNKALKWYFENSLGKTPQKFYDNIQNNIKMGPPCKDFLWPQDLTEWNDGTFGYIMDLRPTEYHELTEFMLAKVRMKSFKHTVDAALRIVSAYRLLHNRGYSYQDLNDGNFFINPDNGRVLICDNDNVAPDNTEVGILGKPRYMAPEIVLGNALPNSNSDRFSMSVILYALFCTNHPLEGKRFFDPNIGMTEARKKKIYGSEALFMMDPDDQSNGPHPVINRNSIIMWKVLPEYMRQIFIKAFSQKSLTKPTARPIEKEWLDVLTRFRSDIVICPSCGDEVFVDNGQSRGCDFCKADLAIRCRLEFKDSYSIPAVKGSRIYRCQLGPCNQNEALDPVAALLASSSDPQKIGIKNKTKKRWNAISSKGAPKTVAPDEVVPVKPGITLNIEDQTITIKQN